MKCIKVCMIVRQFPSPERLTFGSGFVSQAYYLSKALNELGVEVHVLTERKEEPFTEIIEDVYVHRFPKFFTKLGIIGCLGYNFSEARWIKKLLEEHNVDLIHSHAPITGIVYLKRRNLIMNPVVVTFHGTAEGEARAIDLRENFTVRNVLNKYGNFKLQMLLDRYTCRNADRITAPSNATAQEVCEAYNLPPDKAAVIPNGIDAERFNIPRNTLRERLRLRNSLVVLCVGRLVYRKGITHLVKAIPQVLRHLKDVKFIIVGKGPLESSIRSYLAKYGLASNVLMLKDVPEVNMPEVYRSSDLFVLPSLYEAFPMVVLEALASEACVIATRVGGVPEVIKHGKTGTLVRPADVGALKDSIIALSENDALRAAMAKRGKELVIAEYSWEKIASKYSLLYRSLDDRA